jgi:hypothetical protein
MHMIAPSTTSLAETIRECGSIHVVEMAMMGLMILSSGIVATRPLTHRCAVPMTLSSRSLFTNLNIVTMRDGIAVAPCRSLDRTMCLATTRELASRGAFLIQKF